MQLYIQSIKKISVFLLMMLPIASCFGQKGFMTPDSLKQKSYDELLANLKRTVKDSVPFHSYANTYLQKARREQIPIRIVKAYQYFSNYYKTDTATQIKYVDSIIILAKKLKDTIYPALSYLTKGNIYYSEKKFDKALDNYLLANYWAKKNYNLDILLITQKNIGNIKHRIGKYDEAISIYLESYKRHNNHKRKKKYDNNFLGNILDLATAYSSKKNIDSAIIMNKLGYQESLKLKDSVMTQYFSISQGIMCYEKVDYKGALDSLKKGTSFLKRKNDHTNLAMVYSFIGKTYHKLSKKDSAIYYLQQADTVIQNNGMVFYPEIRDNYSLLFELSKKDGKTNAQLTYLEKLMELDSVMAHDYRHINESIIKKYDTPQPLEEKELLIQNLNKEKNKASSWVLLLSILVVLISVILYYNYRKRLLYRKKFEHLMERYAEPKKEKSPITTSSKEHIPEETLGIAPEVVHHITAQLKHFENSTGFSNPNITLHVLASKMNTNSKYLSKIINHQKRKNFSNYLNELRIDYAVKELQTDLKLRNYTIKAIAQHVGFNNAQSFSKAFLKQTGIYPSYFIKNLHPDENKLNAS